MAINNNTYYEINSIILININYIYHLIYSLI